MRISKLAVENFRSLKAITLECDLLTTLVGRNGAGKSAFLQALDLFYRPTAEVGRDDFFGCDVTTPIHVSVTFADLDADEQDAFRPYLDGTLLTVTKTFEGGESFPIKGKYFATRKRYQPFLAIESIPSARDRRAALAEEIDRLIASGKLVTGTVKPTNAAGVDEFIRTFEESHPELTTPQVGEAQFFGDRNVGGGKLDNFTQFVYVPAVRDATEDASPERRTSFTQLMELVVLSKVNGHSAVRGLEQKLQDEVAAAFSATSMDADIKQLESDLNQALQPFVPSASIALEIAETARARFDPPRVVHSVIEDNFKGDVAKKGHGLQRAIILTLLTQLQRAKNRVQDSENGGDEQPRQRSLILGIEEPELYQHPQRCRHFANVLRDLAASKSVQVLATTHSPFFVSLEHSGEVRIVQKSLPDPERPGEASIAQVRVQDLQREWAKICGLDEKVVTIDSMLARIRRSMTAAVNEGFFADGVVLVEGYGEVGILQGLALRLGRSWEAKGLSVLPAMGKSNLGAPALIFRTLEIPTYFLFDGDDRHRGSKKEDATRALNRALLALAAADPVDFPVETAQATYACFSGNLEEYCRRVVGDEDYRKITEKIAEEIGWEHADEVLKNVRGGEEFIAEVYAIGKSLPLLESIVERVTALVPSQGGTLAVTELGSSARN